MNDTPIFWSLVKEMRSQGHSLPWHFMVKPKGTVSILSETSGGIHPPFKRSFKRDLLGDFPAQS